MVSIFNDSFSHTSFLHFKISRIYIICLITHHYSLCEIQCSHNNDLIKTTAIWVRCYEMQAAASYIMLVRFYHTRHHIQEGHTHFGIYYFVLYHIFPTCNRGHFISKIIQGPEVWCPVGVAESSFKWE